MIMFEVLTGEVPFQSIGMDMSELVALISHQPTAYVLNKPRTKEVNTLVLFAIITDPELRTC